jgi:hypothetical protein
MVCEGPTLTGAAQAIPGPPGSTESSASELGIALERRWVGVVLGA